MNSPQTEYKIIFASDPTEVDIDRLTYLINDSFKSSKKKLVDDYFEKEDISEIFHEENYLGAAIIQNINDIPYIDKLAVKETGNGLGTALWNTVTDKYDKLIWRASPGNPANDFYKGKYEGKIQTENWNIYYKGLNNLQENIFNELIKTVASKEPTMIY